MRVVTKVYKDGETAVFRTITKKVSAEEDVSTAIYELNEFLDNTWLEIEEEDLI